MKHHNNVPFSKIGRMPFNGLGSEATPAGDSVGQTFLSPKKKNFHAVKQSSREALYYFFILFFTRAVDAILFERKFFHKSIIRPTNKLNRTTRVKHIYSTGCAVEALFIRL